MRWGLCLRIACKNLLRKKKYTIALFTGMFLIMVLLTVWCVFRNGISDLYRKFLQGKLSDCYYFLDIEIADDGTPVKDDHYRALEQLRQMPEVGERIVTIIKPDIVEYIEKQDEWSRINMNFVSMIVGDTTYQGENDYSNDFEEPIRSDVPRTMYPVIFNLALLGERDFITENDIKEFDYRYSEPMMLCGKDTVEPGEFIISDYYLERFGVPREKYGDLIGKRVTFSAGGKTILEDAVLVGIVDSRLFRMQRFTERKLYGSQVLYRAAVQELAAWGVWYMNAIVPVLDYGKIRVVYERLDEAGLIDEVSAWNNSGLEAYQSLYTAEVIVNRVFGLFAVLIILAVLLYLVNTLWQNIEVRAPYCGMLKAIGMRQREIGCVLFLEIVVIAIPCMIMSVPISVYAFEFFSKMMEGVFTVTVQAKVRDAILIAGAIAGAVVAIVFLAELPMIRRVVRQEAAVLLTEDESK